MLYYPFVEERAGQGKGLISALSTRACVVVTDAYPCFFLPQMLQAAAGQCRVKLESVDSNGLMPLAAVDRVFTSAYSFRRFLQKNMIQYLQDFPEPDPLSGISLPVLPALPADILLEMARGLTRHPRCRPANFEIPAHFPSSGAGFRFFRGPDSRRAGAEGIFIAGFQVL